jgi:prolyl-tRNA editing enzyme YbaK/EbsC (Cys-tRNA(Pro) deacylase)
VGRTPWQILKDADKHPDEIREIEPGHGFYRGRPKALLQSWDRISVRGVPDPADVTFEQRMRHYGNAVRTVPIEWKGALLLFALRAHHMLDLGKVARSLAVEATELRRAEATTVRAALGFAPGFETLITDEAVATFVDIRVTWMRSATIATGDSDLVAAVCPGKLIEITGAAVCDIAAERVPLDEPGSFPPGMKRGVDAVKAVLREVADQVGFPLWIPPELLVDQRFQLRGADWSAGLGSPATTVNRATLGFWMQPGGLPLFLDQCPSTMHHELAAKAWPQLVEAGLERPRMTLVHQIRRAGIGITLVADQDFAASADTVAGRFDQPDFPRSLEAIADGLIPFPLD